MRRRPWRRTWRRTCWAPRRTGACRCSSFIASSSSGRTHAQQTLHSALGRHEKDGHVKDAAQAVAQDVAEDVFGAVENGSLEVLIVASIVIFQRRNPCPAHACRPPRCSWAALEGRDAGRGRGRTTGRGAGLGLRVPGRRAPSSPRHHRRCRRLCEARAEIGAQLGSSVAFGSGCGQALPGAPRKAPLC